MQDKSFLQAIQDLQERISSDYHESIHHMLLHGTTATHATVDIQDECVRAVVTNELITRQIIALLTLLKDLQLLNKAQHDEFTNYLLCSLTSQQHKLIP